MAAIGQGQCHRRIKAVREIGGHEQFEDDDAVLTTGDMGATFPHRGDEFERHLLAKITPGCAVRLCKVVVVTGKGHGLPTVVVGKGVALTPKEIFEHTAADGERAACADHVDTIVASVGFGQVVEAAPPPVRRRQDR